MSSATEPAPQAGSAAERGAGRSGRLRRGLGRGVGVVALLAFGFGLADRLAPPDLSRLATGTDILDRAGRPLAALPAPGGIWRLGTTVAEVPPHLTAMLLAAEDRRFRWHPGIDPLSLGRAAFQWIRAGHVVSGGSTITMQVARLLEPRPRNLRAKAIEVFRALQLESRYSKDEILGLWLTLAPQGGNLEGVRAGALAWFGKAPAALDPAESALLVALARRPEALRPDRHPDAARTARDALLTIRAAAAVGITDADRRFALDTPVPGRRQPMPHLAPHLARQEARAEPAARRLQTTLDAPLQRAVERLAAEARRDLGERSSLAIVIADLRSREIRALAGGAWGEEGRAGALDLSRAVRSPGSALKPFLYALAFEQGIAAPGSILADLPLRFGAYAPENFDHGFMGRVTAAEALRQSLNLPAVALLDRLGPLSFATALKRAGAPPRLPPGADASLPLALGGAGTTLREMTALYATLADGGRAAPLLTRPAAPSPPQQVLSRRAAESVGAILTHPFPGGGPAGIAWKTGTSWGGRDAWSLGYDRAHVVGVWVGRPDGTPMPGATGRSTALPILARLFALLPAAPREPGSFRAVAAPGEAVDRLRLLFPPPGAVLASGEGHVTLRVAGGQRPMTFLVDGAPLPAEAARREAAWTPPGPGFYQVTVLDARGIAARAEVRVR